MCCIFNAAVPCGDRNLAHSVCQVSTVQRILPIITIRYVPWATTALPVQALPMKTHAPGGPTILLLKLMPSMTV